MTTAQFFLTFLWLCQTLSLAKSHRELLASFIKNVLPVNNNVRTYSFMVSKMMPKKQQKLYTRYVPHVMSPWLILQRKFAASAHQIVQQLSQNSMQSRKSKE